MRPLSEEKKTVWWKWPAIIGGGITGIMIILGIFPKVSFFVVHEGSHMVFAEEWRETDKKANNVEQWIEVQRKANEQFQQWTQDQQVQQKPPTAQNLPYYPGRRDPYYEQEPYYPAPRYPCWQSCAVMFPYR